VKDVLIRASAKAGLSAMQASVSLPGRKEKGEGREGGKPQSDPLRPASRRTPQPCISSAYVRRGGGEGENRRGREKGVRFRHLNHTIGG